MFMIVYIYTYTFMMRYIFHPNIWHLFILFSSFFGPFSLGISRFNSKMAKLPPPHEAAAHSSKMRPLPSVHGVLSPEVCVGRTQVETGWLFPPANSGDAAGKFKVVFRLVDGQIGMMSYFFLGGGGSIISFKAGIRLECHHLSFFWWVKKLMAYPIPSCKSFPSNPDLQGKQGWLLSRSDRVAPNSHVFWWKTQVSVYLIHPSLTHNVTTTSNQQIHQIIQIVTELDPSLEVGHFSPLQEGRHIQLGGGFKCLWFSPRTLGFMIHFWHIYIYIFFFFQRGCFNHPTRQPIPKKGHG